MNGSKKKIRKEREKGSEKQCTGAPTKPKNKERPVSWTASNSEGSGRLINLFSVQSVRAIGSNSQLRPFLVDDFKL